MSRPAARVDAGIERSLNHVVDNLGLMVKHPLSSRDAALEVTAGDEIEALSHIHLGSVGTVLDAAVRTVRILEELDASGKLLPISLMSLGVVAL